MFDLSNEMEKFYKRFVVLSSEVQSDLQEKKKLNIKRLKEGLVKYNLDNNKDYKIAEVITQGSIAMKTIVQNDSNDYDIDVAVVFDSRNLDGLGSIAVKHMVVDSLKMVYTGFKKDPEALINCVRVYYSDGYHVDIAVYRRTTGYDGSYSYEHAGSEWRGRNPSSINSWFRDEVKRKGQFLRKTIRLLKMFSKSRNDWQMPGGLIQSVLCDEKFPTGYARLDETFYHCIKGIRDRLIIYKDVINPIDFSSSLILKQRDREKIENLKSRLDTSIDRMQPLFEESCTKQTAMNIWRDFFNHEYWNVNVINESFSEKITDYRYHIGNYSDTEEFIEDVVPVIERYIVNIECSAMANGFRSRALSDFLTIINHLIPQNLKLKFKVKNCTVPGDYKIWWKVRNVGVAAERRNQIRGQLIKNNQDELTENTRFEGPHYVECYIIKDGICVASDKINVPIGNNSV